MPTSPLQPQFQHSNMAGILFRQDGTHEIVRFDASNICSCAETFKRLAVSSGDIDQVDVRAVEQNDGSIEYLCCIYDTAAGRLVSDGTVQLNQHFDSFGACIGDVLMFKTTAKQSCFDDMLDAVHPTIGMDARQCVEEVRRFREKLQKFLTDEDSCEVAVGCPDLLFPFLMRVKMCGGYTYYQCSGFDIRTGAIEVDLLTFKPKRRRLTGMATSLCGLFDAVLDKRNVKRFCVVCREPTRFSCSRCKGYYSCGSAACRKRAWKLHKPSCV